MDTGARSMPKKTNGWVCAVAALGLLAAAPAYGDDASLPKGDVAYGEYLASQCVTCHRTDVFSETIPAIVGLPVDYFIQALREYRIGARENEVMQAVTTALGDEEIASLAAYFGSLDPP